MVEINNEFGVVDVICDHLAVGTQLLPTAPSCTKLARAVHGMHAMHSVNIPRSVGNPTRPAPASGIQAVNYPSEVAVATRRRPSSGR